MASKQSAKEQARARIAAERAALAARERRDRTIKIVAGLVVLTLVVGGGIWWQTSRNQVADTADPGPQVAAERLDDGIRIGSGGPVVDIYLDFLCTHCADLEERVGDEIATMAEQGEATFVVHPLTFLNPAESARSAAALSCAAGTESVLGYQAALFANAGGGFSTERLVEIASSVGLTSDDVVSCIETDAEAGWAAATDAAARERGIEGTPTIFVDDTEIALALTETPEAFRAAVLGAS